MLIQSAHPPLTLEEGDEAVESNLEPLLLALLLKEHGTSRFKSERVEKHDGTVLRGGAWGGFAELVRLEQNE